MKLVDLYTHNANWFADTVIEIITAKEKLKLPAFEAALNYGNREVIYFDDSTAALSD